LATCFEAESAMTKGAGNMTGDVGSMTAYSLAKLCYDTLISYGYEAKIACERQAVTPALERIIEANTLLSGLGFESGGLASCHAIHNGLTVLKQTHGYWHGEKVSIGVLASMFLNSKDRETIEAVYAFCESVGLPTTLEEIGIKKVKDNDLMAVAKGSCAEGETIYNEPVVITEQKVMDAIKAADQYGRIRKGKK
jgi:glycerol dehydrogenase